MARDEGEDRGIEQHSGCCRAGLIQRPDGPALGTTGTGSAGLATGTESCYRRSGGTRSSSWTLQSRFAGMSLRFCSDLVLGGTLRLNQGIQADPEPGDSFHHVMRVQRDVSMVRQSRNQHTVT